MNAAILALEDGTVFEGKSFGAPKDSLGEVVFNTAITGYQEIFTDPSYAGQIVVLTNPQIGNYGANAYDQEAARPYIEGLVVREFSRMASNWRSEENAEQFLAENGIPGSRRDRHPRAGASPADARRDARRSFGGRRAPNESDRARPAIAVHGRARSGDARFHCLAVLLGPAGGALLAFRSRAGTAEQFCHVVAYDYGIKRNILRRLVQVGARVTVVPALTSAEDVLALNPDGVFLSNGPGDPEPLEFQAQQVRKLIGKKPVFGICLGHQILGLALGGKTYKLKFGHRGANHPVLNRSDRESGDHFAQSRLRGGSRFAERRTKWI